MATELESSGGRSVRGRALLLRELYISRSAILSADGAYRYELVRVWNEELPRLAWVCLNPSTADGNADDATVRRCVGFAKAWGFGSIVVVNLFAFRATDPAIMRAAPAPIGPENDDRIIAAMAGAERVVAAWGDGAGRRCGRATDVLQLLAARSDVWCLGTTKTGAPKHPARLARATPLELYVPRAPRGPA